MTAQSMQSDLETVNVDGLTDYLKEVIEEGDYMVPEAKALLRRIEAIVPEQEKKVEQEKEKENYLKNAEMAVEGDYGMIDGIINNGSKEEEKPSIIAELRAAKEARTEKKPEHKEKHHEKKVEHDAL